MGMETEKTNTNEGAGMEQSELDFERYVSVRAGISNSISVSGGRYVSQKARQEQSTLEHDYPEFEKRLENLTDEEISTYQRSYSETKKRARGPRRPIVLCPLIS